MSEGIPEKDQEALDNAGDMNMGEQPGPSPENVNEQNAWNKAGATPEQRQKNIDALKRRQQLQRQNYGWQARKESSMPDIEAHGEVANYGKLASQESQERVEKLERKAEENEYGGIKPLPGQNTQNWEKGERPQ